MESPPPNGTLMPVLGIDEMHLTCFLDPSRILTLFQLIAQGVKKDLMEFGKDCTV